MERLLFTPLSHHAPSQHLVLVHGEIPASIPNVSVSNSPSILITRSAKFSSELNVGTAELSEIILHAKGDRPDYLLLILEDPCDEIAADIPAVSKEHQFIEEANAASKSIGVLAEKVVAGLHRIDDALKLFRKPNGRWMNRGVNFFTLKIQPKKMDIQFTIYGNPSSFSHGGFLRRDQNSYSRGWIATESDVEQFLDLAKQSFQSRVKP